MRVTRAASSAPGSRQAVAELLGLTAAGLGTPTDPQSAPVLLHPICRRPAQRLLAGSTSPRTASSHPRQPRRVSRRRCRGAVLDRGPGAEDCSRSLRRRPSSLRSISRWPAILKGVSRWGRPPIPRSRGRPTLETSGLRGSAPLAPGPCLAPLRHGPGARRDSQASHGTASSSSLVRPINLKPGRLRLPVTKARHRPVPGPCAYWQRKDRGPSARYREVQMQAGHHTITAADPLPPDLYGVLALIHVERARATQLTGSKSGRPLDPLPAGTPARATSTQRSQSSRSGVRAAASVS